MSSSAIQLTKVDYWVLSACAALLAASVFLISDSKVLFRLGLHSIKNLEVVGQVEKKSDDVRRRLSRDLVWFPIDQEDAVFEEDSIFTGQRSETTLLLKDGSLLQIAPGSLVVISQKKGKYILDLSFGAVTGNLTEGKELTLRVNGQETKVLGQAQGSQIGVRLGKLGKVELSVLKGAVDVWKEKNASRSRVSVRERQFVDVAEDLVSDAVKAHSLESTSPADQSEFWVRKEAKVDLSWKDTRGEKAAGPYILEVAGDAKMERTIFSKEQSSQALTVNLQQEGTYYWRVTSKGPARSEAQGPVRRFQVRHEKPVEPIAPALDEKLDSAKGARFEWVERQVTAMNTQLYRLQVSQNEVFRDLVYDGVVSVTRANLTSWLSEKAPTGKYFWRVKVEEAHRPEAYWSAVQHFNWKNSAFLTDKLQVTPVPEQEQNLAALPAPPPPPPIAVKPPDSIKAPQFWLPQPQAIRELDLKQPARVGFVWSPDPHAKSFEIEWATDEAFKHKIESLKVTRNRVENQKEFPLNTPIVTRVRASDGRRVSAWTRLPAFRMSRRPPPVSKPVAKVDEAAAARSLAEKKASEAAEKSRALRRQSRKGGSGAEDQLLFAP